MQRMTAFGVVVCMAAVAVAMVSGGEGHGYGGGWGFESCGCSSRRNPCASNTNGSVYNLCGSDNKFIQCAGTNCSAQNCSAQQLWNSTQKACVPCRSGSHVAAEAPVCVCNEGTTWNITAHSCMNCPKAATVLPDSCFCNSTGPTPFLSFSAWECKSCPGQWVNTVNETIRNGRKIVEVIEILVCQCPAATDIFNLETVSCVTCPTGSTVVKASYPGQSDRCVCPRPTGRATVVYDYATNTCTTTCSRGYTLNTSTNTCVRPTATTTTAPASSG